MPKRPASLAARFKAAGGDQSEIAKRHRKHQSTVSRTLRGKIAKPDPRIARAIARVVGSTVEAEFPALARKAA